MKTILPTFVFLFISIIAFSQELSRQAWHKDLALFKTGLEQKHIDLYNKISKAEFAAELATIEATAGQKSDFGTTIDLMRLTRKIGDGHTAVSLRNLDTHSFPFVVQNFDGHFKIIAVSQRYRHLLGQELTEISRQPIEEVAEKIGEVAQFVENENSLQTRTSQYLTNAELLYGLGIISEKATAVFSFQDETGKRTSEDLVALDKADYNEAEFDRIKIGVPEIEVPANPVLKDFWYAPVSDTSALYIHFESYPKFEEMMAVAEEIVGYIVQNNIRQLVIDLRNNGGGDLYVGLVLANALNMADPIDWKSGVYALCDQVIFSAAASNTALFRELLNAKIVGEPTGSNPTGYQDMDTFELPNSKLVICYSKRLFRIQETPTSGVQPDIHLKYEWKSFSKGKDNMLEWVIKEMKK